MAEDSRVDSPHLWVEIPGHALTFPLHLHAAQETVSEHIRYHRCWEPLETDTFCSLLRQGDTFIDVGANIGYYSLLASHLLGNSGRIIAFEPDERNFSLLTANIALNAARVQAIRAAVGAQEGTISLIHSDTNFGDHRIEAAADGSDADQVAVKPLGPILRETDGRIVIKIDTQGSELAILKGMMQDVRDCAERTLALVEFWPYGLARAGAEAREVIDLLESLPWKMLEINETRLLRAPVTAANLRARLEADLSVERAGFTNLLLYPAEEEETVAGIDIHPLFLRRVEGLSERSNQGLGTEWWSERELVLRFAPPRGGSAPVSIAWESWSPDEPIRVVARSGHRSARLEIEPARGVWRRSSLAKLVIGPAGLDVKFTCVDDTAAFAIRRLEIVRHARPPVS